MARYTEVESPKELAKLNDRLSSKLRAAFKHTKRKIIGYPQGSFEANVHFRRKVGDAVFWWAKGNTLGHNFFGHASPANSRALNIEAQFNFSFPKFSHRQGGCFLSDNSTKEIILGHRGIVTLGHSRIKKNDLFAEIDATLEEASTSRGPRDFLLIGRLESANLINEIEGFSSELRRAVRAIKASPKSDRRRTRTGSRGQQFPALKDYFDEFWGKSKIKARGKVIADCYHGDVVRALHKELSKYGKTQKNRPVDLVAKMKSRAFLFEVKPSIGSQSIYTAIGQLAVHAPSVAACVGGAPLQKVIVLPARPARGLYDAAFHHQGIKVLLFSRSPSGRVTFDGLSDLIANKKPKVQKLKAR